MYIDKRYIKMKSFKLLTELKNIYYVEFTFLISLVHITE